MHWPTQGQWWSKRSTQLLQIEQCEHRGGLYSMQVSQYLTFTMTPFTITSFVRGNRNCCGVWPFPASLFISIASGSGGWVLRGTIPGSLPEVNSSSVKSWKTKEIRFSRRKDYSKLVSHIVDGLIYSLKLIHKAITFNDNPKILFALRFLIGQLSNIPFIFHTWHVNAISQLH